MKRVLLLSLLLNVVLLGLLAWRSAPQSIPARPARGEVGPSAAKGRGSARLLHFVPAWPAGATPWTAIESPNLRQLMANLRALGCPEETIRDLVVTRICRMYRNRLLAEEFRRLQAWDPTRPRDLRERLASTRVQQRLRNEMMSEAETLLGQPWSRLLAGVTGWTWAFSGQEYLPLDKRHRLRELELQHAEQRDELDWRGQFLVPDSEDHARVKEMQRQQEAEIAALLTPTEFAEWQYRESRASWFARLNLPPAESEAEFRQMVDLVREFDLTDRPATLDFRTSVPGAENDPEAQDYLHRKAIFDVRLKELLGEDRVAVEAAAAQERINRELQRSQAPSEEEARREFAAMAEAAGLAAAEADRFYQRLNGLEPGMSSRLAEMDKQFTGSPEEKRRQMQAVVEAEVERLAVEALGEKGRDFVRRMKERDGGR
jgi:hypothetical protein